MDHAEMGKAGASRENDEHGDRLVKQIWKKVQVEALGKERAYKAIVHSNKHYHINSLGVS